MVVLAPANLQEAVDVMADAFDIADQYRNPVMVLADGLIGQMMEPIVWKEHTPRVLPEKTWAADGRRGRAHNNFITSLLLEADACEKRNIGLKAKFDEMEKNECRWEEVNTEDAEVILVAYGTPARIALSAAEQLRAQGIKAGVLRPITVWPFPHARLRELAEGGCKGFLAVEMSQGQMVDEVRMAVGEKKPVGFYGRCGGVVPTVSEVRLAAEKFFKEVQ